MDLLAHEANGPDESDETDGADEVDQTDGAAEDDEADEKGRWSHWSR